MEWLLYTYIGLSLLAAPVGLAVSYVAWTRRRRPGIFSFFCFIAVCSWWATSGALSLLGPTQEVALFWQVPVRMAAVILLPVAFLAFALEYAGYRRWLEPRRFVWLLVIPTISELINWTPLYPLLISNFEFIQFGSFFVRQDVIAAGSWFPIHQAYCYALAAAGVGLIFLQMFRTRHFHRRQAAVLFVGVVLVFGANAFSVLTPVVLGAATPWLDWTDVTFAVSGIAWLWALSRGQFLDVMPVALDAVFASMDDAVIVLDNANRIIDLNAAGSALLAQARGVAVGAPLQDISGALALAVERPELPAQRAEFSIGDRVFELRLSPLEGRPGRPAGKLAVLRDITERAQMMKDLDAYARTVAHDLKNPLAVIIGAAYLIESADQPLDPETQRRVAAIGEIGSSMAAIINNLLLLASLRSVKEVKTTPLEMKRIVDAARQRLADQAARLEAQIIVPTSWPAARGYAPWVQEIWANYLSNALKYGGTPPSLEIGASTRAGAVCFWVRDNGVGLDKETATQLFGEFSRLDREHAMGHGLGLSIVSRIAKKLGGEAGVDTEPGAGCTFWFTLPPA